MKRFLLTVGVIFLLTLGAMVAACGGSSGGTTGPTTNAFIGTYFWHAIEGEIGPPLDNGAQWGTLAANGLGMVTGGSVSGNDAGAIIGPLAVGAFPYTIGAGNRVTLNSPSGVIEGGIAADGRLLAGVTTGSGSIPALAIMHRQAGTFTTASLNGTYHCAAVFFGAGTENTWFDSTFTFNGAAGTVTGSAAQNANGTITAAGAPVAFGTYTVAPDGTVTWNTPIAALSWQGGLLAGGDILVLSGVTTANDAQYLLVLLRQGAGLSAATFSGNYHIVGISALNTPPPRYPVFTGTSTSNGAGTWTFLGATTNTDGTITTGGAVGGLAYTVSPIGELVFGTGGLTGAVSPGGHFAVLSGGTANLSTPGLWFLHR